MLCDWLATDIASDGIIVAPLREWSEDRLDLRLCLVRRVVEGDW
jgi:hypothetical protein